LRSALAEFDCELLAFAGEFEGPDFWGDRRPVLVTPADLAHEPLDAVVLPAWVEFQPRTLLAALAAGIPVVATTACGLPPREGLALCPPGDIARLREALAHALESV
jgi:glycosyltransferase involved in cell wall biosynthesis